MVEATLEVPEVLKEPPQIEGALVTEDIPGVPEILREPPQIDQSNV